jgi:uncharacterized protein (DUF1778 family)
MSPTDTLKRPSGTRYSEARSAAVIVRMSLAERDALRQAAEARGASINDLLLDRVREITAQE